ncbi:hypothetical protein CGRA01v4_03172 [Colletotrichum graminicola]|nr:hypothetical protein CGRA01v4_03172 [Colletotrichum graminicola]
MIRHIHSLTSPSPSPRSDNIRDTNRPIVSNRAMGTHTRRGRVSVRIQRHRPMSSSVCLRTGQPLSSSLDIGLRYLSCLSAPDARSLHRASCRASSPNGGNLGKEADQDRTAEANNSQAATIRQEDN